MTRTTRTLDRAVEWCLTGRVSRPVRPPDRSLGIVETTSIRETCAVAAREYEAAVADGAERVVFAVRDSRAPKAKLAAGLREQGVPLDSVPAVPPLEDPVVDELLQVTTALTECQTEGEIQPATRRHLAARVEATADVDTVLSTITSCESLSRALRTWIRETRVVDRLLGATDGTETLLQPAGEVTVDARASAERVATVLDVATHLEAVSELSGGPSMGAAVLASAIEDGVMSDTQPLLGEASGQSENAEAELVDMTALKLAGAADRVVALEVTEALFDEHPRQDAFDVAPWLGNHPETPGVTTVAETRAAAAFGPVSHIEDGRRAWYAGLGRRSLGQALAAARNRAVIVTRRSTGNDTGVRPSRTSLELRNVLSLDQCDTSRRPAPAASQSEGSEPATRDVEPAALIERLEASLSARVPCESGDGEGADGGPAGDDATLQCVVEYLTECVQGDAVTDAELRALLDVLAEHDWRAASTETNTEDDT